jgi:hypothetical protein
MTLNAAATTIAAAATRAHVDLAGALAILS